MVNVPTDSSDLFAAIAATLSICAAAHSPAEGEALLATVFRNAVANSRQPARWKRDILHDADTHHGAARRNFLTNGSALLIHASLRRGNDLGASICGPVDGRRRSVTARIAHPAHSKRTIAMPNHIRSTTFTWNARSFEIRTMREGNYTFVQGLLDNAPVTPRFGVTDEDATDFWTTRGETALAALEEIVRDDLRAQFA